MAYATVQSWSTTAGDHTEINGNDIDENCEFADINDAIRELMAQCATGRTANQFSYMTYRSVSSGDTLVAGDRGRGVVGTASLTLGTTAAATLGAGWWCVVRALGADVVIDPNSSEQVDGAASVTIPDGQGVIVMCNGTAFTTSGFVSTSTFATLTGTQTLTNKTLTDPTFDNDLLIDSGGVINFASGDVTITHASNLLTLAGGNVDFGDNQLIKPLLKDYGEVTNALGDTGGGTDDIDLTAGNAVSATVSTAEQTFTFSNPTASDECCSFVLVLTNGGSQTVNWPASVDWAGGTAPSLTTSGVDILEFVTIDGGTTWFGFASGLDMQ